MDLLKRQLIQYGMELGFDSLRVTGTEPLSLWQSQVELRKEKDPSSSYLWDNMHYDPRAIMPEAKSIIVAIRPHTPHKVSFSKGIARFSAYYREYPKGRDGGRQLGLFLEGKGYKAIVQPPLPAKEIAFRAGIGYFGKNGLIHTEEHGSWISLHYILTNAPLVPDQPMDRISDCGDCQLCMDACPMGAIEKEGQVTPSKCIRYYMLSSDFIPLEIRDKMGLNILGCDICQTVCPFNRLGVLDASLPQPDEMELFDIGKILEEGSISLKDRMNRLGDLIGRNYARAQKILSAATILAGNSGDSSYLPYLTKLLTHPHPPIRAHSAWAIGKIGHKGYRDILSRALVGEEDQKVIEEIHGALNSNKYKEQNKE
ncbi:MAG TPA: 4Fe-4S double cluster binding domain-containing protein [Clostridia bacterium]|nr:4Fe-4S double cluster binding domain-containing protein [Clostridia bacterium]